MLRRVKTGFDPQSRMLTVQCGEVRMSPEMAEKLGDPMLADVVLGEAIMRSAVAWVGGARPEIAPADEPHGHGQAGAMLAEGCDMTFCQLYGMYQPARLGDTVASGGVSWQTVHAIPSGKKPLSCQWHAVHCICALCA